ncbi:Ribulose-5-phosphate 4-epimerase and related epimerases and aldolases [Kingella potus]|uniref:Ribulose-5-phosphate 4-epimerase and related epimerases and aldolases n=1 Tax=Kingella potus TaxID=265175 RepID=A0A377R254_9NEIS|nr:ankyrin repeat domain-containing protein [Kingella potus]UOP01134.1 ankyrin repeat domain-containing protein [Kingella potus]STR00838.1 Ribulose-5-phosphate 4-epimerase and related epimerases and aldolases [Kingella potus]
MPQPDRETLFPVLMNEDTAAMDTLLADGWRVNYVLKDTNGSYELPSTLAVKYRKINTLAWLIAHGGIDTNPNCPTLIDAARYGDEAGLRLLLAHGADINARTPLGVNALDIAIYGKHYALLPVLLELGYDIAADDTTLREAVFDKDHRAIDFLLAHGADPNRIGLSTAFSDNESPLTVAAWVNDFPAVQKLVAHGADVCHKDKKGKRAYNHAVAKKNTEMAQFLKELEPEEWHSEEQRLLELKSYKLPAALIEILRRPEAERRFALPGLPDPRWIQFTHITATSEVKWHGYKLLDLLSGVDNYSAEGFLMWYPKGKCLASLDWEHQEFRELGSMKDFLANPSAVIAKVFEAPTFSAED